MDRRRGSADVRWAVTMRFQSVANPAATGVGRRSIGSKTLANRVFQLLINSPSGGLSSLR